MQCNLSGKTMVQFNTNASYGVGSSFHTVKEPCPNCTVLDGFKIEGGAERDGMYFVMKGQKATEAEKEVKNWLKKLNLVK